MSNLSKLVAVRVMGWNQSRIGPVKCWVVGDDVEEISFDPDSSIADAWRVVEKVGTPFDCGSPYRRGDVREPAWARFGGNMAEPSPASTIPRAICIAALRACGVPESEIEEARKQ